MNGAAHSARLIALQSAMLALLVEYQTEHGKGDTLTAVYSCAHRSYPEDDPYTFDLVLTDNGMPVAGEGGIL
jgi:hypothetical protein